MICLDLAPGQKIIDLKTTLNSGHEMPVITCRYSVVVCWYTCYLILNCVLVASLVFCTICYSRYLSNYWSSADSRNA